MKEETTITTGDTRDLKPGYYLRTSDGDTFQILRVTSVTTMTVSRVRWWQLIWWEFTKERSLFPLWKFLGECGFFRYQGLRGFQPRWWPRARVRYDAGVSAPMAIGDACQYAEMFNGEVIELNGPCDPFRGES